LFATINGWTPIIFFWRRHTPFFIAKNILVFPLIVQRVFSFSSTTFRFCFSPWFLFRSCYIFVSRCIYTTDLCWFSSQKSCFKKVWMVLEKRKSFMTIVVQMGAYLDCGLDFACHAWCWFDSMLSSFAIAWLVSNDWDFLICLWKNHMLFLLYGSMLLWFSPLMLYLGWLGACLHHVWL
jgi:hypothetical protein